MGFNAGFKGLSETVLSQQSRCIPFPFKSVWCRRPPGLECLGTENISLARGIHCCPSFPISFVRPASPYRVEYVYIYRYLRTDCIWITFATK